MIHNGIIENFAELKLELVRKGVTSSETDTEVAAALLGDIYRNQLHGESNGGLTKAMQLACQRLEGAFTLLAVHADQPDVVVAARRNSPLVVGLGDGENFLGSDVSGFIDYTRRAVELGQDQIVTITADTVEITDFYGAPAEGKEYHVDWDLGGKGGFRPSWKRKSTTSRTPCCRPCWAARTSTALTLDELGSTRSCSRTSTRSSSSPAAPPPTPDRWPSTRSSTGAGSPPRWSSLTNSATATRSWTRTR